MKKIKELIKKYSEQLKYLIVGVATTLVSWGMLYICNDLIGMNRTDFGGTISKAIATVISVIFAFFAGKLFVFNDKDWKVKTVLGQFVKFVGGRAVTMAFEIGSVAAFADGLKVNIYVVNLIVSVVVIIANYLISKFFVFKKEKNKMSEAGYVIKKADKVDFSLAKETKITKRYKMLWKLMPTFAPANKKIIL